MVQNDNMNNSWITRNINYTRLYKVLKETMARCVVFSINLNTVTVTEELDITFESKDKGRVTLPLTNWSLSQLCGLLNIPTSYIKRCHSSRKNKLLASENLNRWIPLTDKYVYVFASGDVCRGILSSNFIFIPDDFLFKCLGTTYPEREFELTGVCTSTEVFEARVSQRQPLPIAGCSINPCLYITNSCVGRSSLTLSMRLHIKSSDAMVVIPDMPRYSFKKYIFNLKHSSPKIQSVREKINESKMHYDAICTNLTTIIQNLNAKNITPDIAEQLLGNIANNYALSQEVVDKIKESIYKNQPKTHWQFVEAVSQVSVAPDITVASKEAIEESTSYLVAFGLK